MSRSTNLLNRAPGTKYIFSKANMSCVLLTTSHVPNVNCTAGLHNMDRIVWLSDRRRELKLILKSSSLARVFYISLVARKSSIILLSSW